MVYILLSATGRAYFYRSIAIKIGDVSRYFSKISGSGVDVTLLIGAAKGGALISKFVCVTMVTQTECLGRDVVGVGCAPGAFG